MPKFTPTQVEVHLPREIFFLVAVITQALGFTAVVEQGMHAHLRTNLCGLHIECRFI